MSGFIPMVSTTPPPIDDDDFGDFMDSSQAEQDDFADFTAPVSYDDLSFPSLNSPEDASKSMNFHTEDKSPIEVKGNFVGNENEGDTTDQEVEVILKKTQVNGSEKGDTSDSPKQEVPMCNGTADPELSNGVDEEHPHPESTKDHMEGGDDWMDFDSASPPLVSEMTDYDAPVERVSSDLHTFEGSPEPELKDFPPNSNDLHTFEGSPEPELKDFPPISNSMVSEQCQFSPSPPSDDDFQAFSQDTTTDGFTRGIENKVSDDDNSLGNFGKDSIDEEFEDFQSTNVDRNKLDGEENKADLSTAENLNDSKVAEADLQKSLDDKEQLPENTESKQSCNDKTSDSEVKSGDFDSVRPDTNTLSEEKDLKKHMITDPDSTDIPESHTVPNSDFADFDSPEQKSDKTIPQNCGQEVEESSQKEIASDAFSEFESSTSETSQKVKEFEADFDAFTSQSGADEKEDETFADFGSANILSSTDQTEGNQNIPADSDSEFAALESESGTCDGFADFSNSQPANEAEFGDFSAGDDDFGDFSSGSASTWSAFSNTVTKKLSLKEKVANYCSKFCEKRDDEKPDEEEHIPHLDEQLSSDVLPPSKDADSPSTTSVESVGILWPGDLWYQLEDIDNAIALNFLWNGSGHNKHLLDSLGMFTQNILFSGAKQAYYVPTYYAAGLDLIDPTKGILKPMSAAEKITAMSPTDKNISTTKEDLHPDETHTEWKTIADDPSSRNSMNVDGSWLQDDRVLGNHTGAELSTDSGPVPIISSTMDLDFFDSLPSVGDGGKLEGSTDLIDPELLELTSAPTTEPPPPPKDFGTATLSKILSSITSSNNAQSASNVVPGTTQENSKWEEEESKLSVEARSVLKKLPTLSYMKAKVLMFPINMSRVNIGDD